MHKVAIIGNITKDIYLRLDNRLNKFEEDDKHVKWLDFSFDGSSHDYYSRVAAGRAGGLVRFADCIGSGLIGK